MPTAILRRADEVRQCPRGGGGGRKRRKRRTRTRKRTRKRTRRRRTRVTLIKSSNPHLAGGEKTDFDDDYDDDDDDDDDDDGDDSADLHISMPNVTCVHS